MRTSRNVFLVVLALLMWTAQFTQAGGAKSDPITFHVSVVPADPFDPSMQVSLKSEAPKIRRGQVVKVMIQGELESGFHTYPLTVRTARQSQGELWTVRPSPPKGIVPLWPMDETAADYIETTDENKKPVTKLEHHKSFTWTQDWFISPDLAPGEYKVPIKLDGQVCNEHKCLRRDPELNAVLVISGDAPVAFDSKFLDRASERPPPPAVVTIPGQEAIEPPQGPNQESTSIAPGAAAGPKDGILYPIAMDVEQYKKTMDDIASKMVMKSVAVQGSKVADLWAFVLAGIFWGGISLITPCVFPMIPITVSFFLKQSEKEHHKPVTMALVYSGTIVIVLTLAAAFLLSVFRWLSVNPFMNYGLGLLFIFFALSLFGMYEIELPSGLARYTSSHEGQGGLVGTMFMALTFTIISFACVAPFLGGFGGTAAGIDRPMYHNLAGGLAFSLTFAAPFFFLALFPTLLRKMPRSGSWLNSVKVVMGFLELGAAIKFFRSAELVLTGSEPWLFTFDFSLGMYVALAIVCGLYLLGLFRLPHDSPEEHLSVPRMMFAAMFLAGALYLSPALFKDVHGDNLRPRGSLYAWVDSFLLPEASVGKEDPHSGNLLVAIKQSRDAKETGGATRRIFLDFTGVTCTNCNINENDVFPKTSIRDLLRKYLTVKLYTDTVPTRYFAPELRRKLDGEAQKAYAKINLNFQRKLFDEQLPLYVVLEPTANGKVDVVGVYPEGRINDQAAFAEFLRNPQ